MGNVHDKTRGRESGDGLKNARNGEEQESWKDGCSEDKEGKEKRGKEIGKIRKKNRERKRKGSREEIKRTSTDAHRSFRSSTTYVIYGQFQSAPDTGSGLRGGVFDVFGQTLAFLIGPKFDVVGSLDSRGTVKGNTKNF